MHSAAVAAPSASATGHDTLQSTDGGKIQRDYGECDFLKRVAIFSSLASSCLRPSMTEGRVFVIICVHYDCHD
jgi:hypothetical protein